MKLKAQLSEINTIAPKDLKDGEIAVITYWGSITSYHGEVIMRNGKQIVCLGQGADVCWLDFQDPALNDCKVRVFQPGESIVFE